MVPEGLGREIILEHVNATNVVQIEATEKQHCEN
jgi:hypothetical protein